MDLTFYVVFIYLRRTFSFDTYMRVSWKNRLKGRGSFLILYGEFSILRELFCLLNLTFIFLFFIYFLMELRLVFIFEFAFKQIGATRAGHYLWNGNFPSLMSLTAIQLLIIILIVKPHLYNPYYNLTNRVFAVLPNDLKN